MSVIRIKPHTDAILYLHSRVVDIEREVAVSHLQRGRGIAYQLLPFHIVLGDNGVSCSVGLALSSKVSYRRWYIPVDLSKGQIRQQREADQ